METNLAALEAAVGHHFRDASLLNRALTHRSVASDRPQHLAPQANNEQLEFLGDAVLGMIVSETLLRRHPDLSEGRLTVMKSRLVSASHLYRIARTLNLGEYLILSRGEDRSGGREKKTLLADALEAIIAAVFLDGGYDVVQRFVEEQIIAVTEASDGDPDRNDPKGALQELAQSMKFPAPRYRVLEETGPDHRKQFTVEVRVGKDLHAAAQGGSKKAASQRAASIVLETLMKRRAPEDLAAAPPVSFETDSVETDSIEADSI
jgi:ribonuclease III